jgi:hypothetical protein
MAIYPTIPLTVPTVGGSSGGWATILNTALLAVDGHSHLGVGSGGAQIVSAAININADLTFASYSATNLRSATFAAGQAVSGVRKLYVGADAELYWNNSTSGAAIQLTNGTALNVSAFIGGIGGDYTSVSAALNYDNSAARYTLRAGGGTTWARVAAGEVRIHEHASTSSIYVALAAPAGIASPYTVTFPAAVPAAKRLVQVSAAGVLTFENTGIEAATFSGLITPTGGIAAATFTGLITASAGVTCAANQHVTVSGTGEVKHGDRVLTIPGCAGVATAGVAYSTTHGGISSTAGTTIHYAIPLKQGDRVTSVTFALSGDGSVDFTAIDFILSNTSTDVNSSLGSTVVNNIGSLADTTINLTDTTIAANESVFMYFTVNATAAVIRNIRVTYSRP